MRTKIGLGVALALMILNLALPAGAEKRTPDSMLHDYAGSKSCVQCHERFYKLWSTSRHGLAMQPYTLEFARKNLSPQPREINIGKDTYRADTTGGWVIEKGPNGQKKHKIEHVLGGKNVYYFLTPFPGGRLQTLPVAYDVRKNEWFDTAASGIRHFPGAERDRPAYWKDQGYTFNTGCYNCHVSQLTSNYDLRTDTYATKWAEPGINCETCHGPSAEHNRAMKGMPKGKQPENLKIISTKKFTSAQHNASCSGCHAKMSPLTTNFVPGDRFFDHYDIATLEDPDFYPDGRDLGENYTYTSWLMSPCAKAGKINCVTCHTSSGRYRFKTEEKANDACMPCHEKHVKNAPAHTNHKTGSAGNRCVSCHMPVTSFARMKRTDHSMLPPVPLATVAYKSPNACNLCHTDRDAVWADRYVRKWRTRDYQAPLLRRAALIDAARRRDWKELPAMLEYITSKDRDEVFVASLIRMIPASGDVRIGSTLLKAMGDSSALVRGSAVDALQHVPGREAIRALVAATGDEYRLVRIRAASALVMYPGLPLNESEKKSVEIAHREYITSLTARPDQWSSYYNLGNYYLKRNEPQEAVVSYDRALKIEPRAALVRVNKAMAYARMGQNKKAGESLKRALEEVPDNPEANFNMGLLKAEEKDLKEAERYLRKALKHGPRMARAAYNLCIIISRDRVDEAIGFCRKAADLRPDNPGYSYTLAFYQNQRQDEEGAIKTLETLIARQPFFADAYILLGEIYEKQGMTPRAEAVYEKGITAEGVSGSARARIKARLDAIKGSGARTPGR